MPKALHKRIGYSFKNLKFSAIMELNYQTIDNQLFWLYMISAIYVDNITNCESFLVVNCRPQPSLLCHNCLIYEKYFMPYKIQKRSSLLTTLRILLECQGKIINARRELIEQLMLLVLLFLHEFSSIGVHKLVDISFQYFFSTQYIAFSLIHQNYLNNCSAGTFRTLRDPQTRLHINQVVQSHFNNK